MYKLLIVDDEPLVQIGIKSMLSWQTLKIELCELASNGKQALKIIEKEHPDIIITDIKMPVMSGLELSKICRDIEGPKKPYIIILTSYEDFNMAREALSYQVSDYLIKLELTPSILEKSIKKILANLEDDHTNTSHNDVIHPYYDKFFICLLNNLFVSEEQFALQGKELKLNFNSKGYYCCYGELHNKKGDSLPFEKQLSLFSSSMQMIRELSTKYISCYAISLDTKHFALIFCCETQISLIKILTNINYTLEKYYQTTFHCGIGSYVDSPILICESFQYARKTFLSTTSEHPIISLDDCSLQNFNGYAFNMSLFKANLIKSFEEYDATLLNDTILSITTLFSEQSTQFVQALDAACNILFLSLSLLQDGDHMVSTIFKDNPYGYRSIYKLTTVDQIISWLTFFSSNLCIQFELHLKDHKNFIVNNVKKYIQQHLYEHLSLNETAAVFGISPNYLSQLFGKYSELGFSEYINSCKIKESKKILESSNLKIYEIAEMLGFESAFYFSKVFKKIEGKSPSEYLNTLISLKK